LFYFLVILADQDKYKLLVTIASQLKEWFFLKLWNEN